MYPKCPSAAEERLEDGELGSGRTPPNYGIFVDYSLYISNTEIGEASSLLWGNGLEM